MKRLLVTILTVAILLSLSGCGKKWTCDQCGEDFRGKAYYDFTETLTMCKDCARSYWMPFPYQNYQK